MLPAIVSSRPGSQTPLRQAECEHASAGSRPTSPEPEREPAGGASAGDREALRCACGSLLARYVGGQIELKCRRCKRTVIVPITDGGVDEE